MTAKKLRSFIDKMEDEICKKSDIEEYDDLMVALAKELSKRYLSTDTHAADFETVRDRLVRTKGIGEGFGIKEIIDGANDALAALDRLEGRS